VALGAGPLQLAWNAVLLAIDHAGLLGALGWSVLLGCLASILAIVGARRFEPSAGEPAIRGPLTYAGPGSLGGTESAVRR
jgi:hypothetical protein